MGEAKRKREVNQAIDKVKEARRIEAKHFGKISKRVFWATVSIILAVVTVPYYLCLVGKFSFKDCELFIPWDGA